MNLKTVFFTLLMLSGMGLFWSEASQRYLLSVVNLKQGRLLKTHYLPVVLPGAILRMDTRTDSYSGDLEVKWSFNHCLMLKGKLSGSSKKTPLQSYGVRR